MFSNHLHISKNLNFSSVQEIIALFTNIDKKISSLHECSSEDFLKLNAHFKNFFKQSKSISGNATTIFDIIAGKDNQSSFQDLNSFHNKLISHLNSSVGKVNQSISTLEKIFMNLELMYLPLKNFKQNLMTLKYLGTSLKINGASVNDETKAEVFETNRKKLEELIIAITSVYPVIDDNLKKLNETVKYSLFKLQKIKDRNTLNIENILNQVHSSIHLSSEKHESTVEQMPRLTVKTTNCSDSIGKIIENLQFQDIIRQKMEHIQKMQKNLVGELETININDKDNTDTIQDEYLIKIRDISGLQAAILLHTNNEYQKAIEIITRKFIEIGEDVSDISEICQQFSGLTHNPGETFFNEIENKLVHALSLVRNYDKANEEFAFEVDTIHIEIEKMSSNFDHVIKIESKLNQLAVSFADYVENDQLSGVRQLISILVSDLQVIKENVKQLFDQTLSLSISLISGESSEVNNNGQQTLTISEDIHAIIGLLENNNANVNKLLNENKEISEQILSEIRNAIKEVKYYDYFEKVIEEIIIELNSIYYKLKTGEEFNYNKADSLKDIEKLYTTHSERAIHHHMVSRDEENMDIFKEVEKIDTNTSEDDSLELF